MRDRLWAVVERAGRPHPVISLRDGQMWLEGIDYSATMPAALVSLRSVEVPGGQPMRAVLLCGTALTEGCHLEVRLLAMVEDPSLKLPPLGVAVPLADPLMASVSTHEELPGSFADALCETLTILGYGSPSLASADALPGLLSKYSRARGGSEGRSGAAPEGTGAEGDRVQPLPWRFQQYLEDLLLPEERLLALAVRRPFEVRSGAILAGRRRYLEGVCAVTDRGLLFFEDALVPDLTMVQWGYHAVAVAAERISDCGVREEGGALSLSVTVEAKGGSFRWGVPFAADQRQEVEALAQSLSRFSRAEVHGLALQRLPDLSQEVPQSALAAVHGSRLSELLGEAPLQLGIAAASFRHGAGSFRSGASMVVATPSALATVEERQGQLRVGGRWSYGSIAWVGLQRSVTGYWLEFACAGENGPSTHRVSFASEEFDGFHGVFLALRRGIAYPPAGLRGDLYEEDLEVGSSRR